MNFSNFRDSWESCSCQEAVLGIGGKSSTCRTEIKSNVKKFGAPLLLNIWGCAPGGASVVLARLHALHQCQRRLRSPSSCVTFQLMFLYHVITQVADKRKSPAAQGTRVRFLAFVPAHMCVAD